MFENEIKKLLVENSQLREAIIIEELTPFFVRDGDSIIMTSQLRCRLKEIDEVKKDCQAKHNEFVKDLIKKLKFPEVNEMETYDEAYECFVRNLNKLTEELEEQNGGKA